MMQRARRILLLSLSGLLACACGSSVATTGGQEADPTAPKHGAGNDAGTIGDAEAAVREFAEAKLSEDFGRMWDLSHNVYRETVVAIGRRIAERDTLAAEAQGFRSPAELRTLSDREYFVRSRQAHARNKQFVYPPGSHVASVEARQPILVPFPGQRLRVVPVVVKLSDGSCDKLGAARDEGGWRIVSELYHQVGKR